MLRNVPARSRSFRATLFGRSAVPKRRRRSRSKRPPIGAEQLESRAMLAGVDINGGLSWNGWTNRGLSNQAGLYGSGGMADTELYEVYTTAFAFDATSNTITDNPVQAVAPAPTGFETGRTVPTPFGPLVVSAGAFQAGNTILGIGVRATGTGSITSFKPTLRFDLDNDSYAPASATGGTVGRTSFSSFSEQGDFTVQFEGASSWRGSTISVQAGSRTGQAATYTGTNNTVLLPGGVGSGTSYDFAFRAFAQPAAKSYQMFLDMTAIPSLYGSVYATFFPGKAGVGPIGDRVTVSLNGLGSNNVVFDANLTLPPVDLDVDSDSADTIPDPANDPVDRSAAEEAIEADSTMPGVIVPVGADRAKMVVDVPAGRTATLAVTQGAEKVRLWTAPTGGTAISAAGTTIVGGAVQAFWIEALSPSASMADIAFTLTPTGCSPASADTIRATAMAVNLEVIPSEVDEDSSQGIIYTFARSVALPTPLTIAYDVVGGTATEGIDYTGLPPATGGRSITIPANATTASVAVFPILDTEIEYDETVVLTLLPGAGYGLGTRTVATGTILNDDYLLDLVLDGLPEETAPEPNELSPGAFLPSGDGRKRLELVVHSPSNAGTITLSVPSGTARITLWDAETGGQQVFPGQWQVGQQPQTLWVENAGLEESVELVAMFQHRGRAKVDKANVSKDVDLDVDSDNNDGLKTPKRDEEEIEPRNAKKLVVNDNDTDGDHVPDYADWSIPGKRFTPLVIEIPTGPPLASMQLTVSYAASDPALIGPDRRLPDDSATNPLRIWTKNAGELRNTASVTAGGTFVPAGRIIEDLNTLGFNDDKRIVELYVEGIHTTAGVPQPISIQLTVGGRATTPDLVNVVVVSNTLVIGIDGTDSAEWLAKRDAKGNLFNERTMPDGSTRWNSHVRNLVADCEPFAMTYYTAGPDQRGLFDDSDAVFRRARDAARALIQDAGGGTTIALVGWSRGAMIASGVAHALLALADGDLPRTVAFIGMYDPVDMSNGILPAWATIHAGVQAVAIIGPTADRQTEDAFNVDYPVADGGLINPSFERMALENRITTAQGAAAVPQRKFYNASHGAIGGTPGYNKRHRDGGEFPENYDYGLDVQNSILADKDVRAGMRAAGLTFVPDRDAAWYGFPDDRPPKEHRA
ncbi:MAG: hypothetical protein ACK6CT_13385 [Planctomycetia bacterium]|jgi:hypothetical protein